MYALLSVCLPCCSTMHFSRTRPMPTQCPPGCPLSRPVCRAPRPPQRHSGCTALWEGACFAPSWGTSCWWSPRQPTTGCSTGCRAALPTRACGDTACPESATCRPTASVSTSTSHSTKPPTHFPHYALIMLSYCT